MDTVTIGIAFKVPEEIKQQLKNLYIDVASKFPTKTITDYKNFDPHITIYHVKFPRANKEKVLAIVESIANETKSMAFRPEKVNVKFNFLGITFEVTDSIQELHENIVTQLNPLREGIIKNTYIEKAESYSSTEREYIAKYGYPYVFTEYRPHITIVNLEHESDIENAKEIIQWSTPFSVNELTVLFSEKDENGNVKKGIKTIELYENN